MNHVPRARSSGATSLTDRESALLREIGDLTAALDAIRTGGVDAVMVPGPDGDSLYTLTSADRPYRVFVEEMGDGAATISERGIILYANNRFAELVRRERSALLGRDLTTFVRPTQGDVLARLTRTAPATTRHAEVDLVRPDGSTIPVLASVTGLDLDGVVVRCLVVSDLTARVEAEERFRITMDSATIGMALVSPGGRFLLVNPALCQILGRDAERMRATTWTEVTHPDDLDEGRSLMGELTAGRVPSFRTRKRYLRPDGSVVWGDLTESCVRNDDGSVRYFIAQVMDVTDAVRAERELVRREAELRAIADSSADILVRTSPEGRIDYVSPAVTRILGWDPQEILGLPAAEFVHPDDLAQAVAPGPSTGWFPPRTRLRRRDGTYRWISARVTPVGDPGNPEGFVAVVRDVEELVRQERALEESERHYRSLVAGAAEAMYEAGPDRLVTWMSPSITALLGWAPDELVGTAMSNLLHPDDKDRIEPLSDEIYGATDAFARTHALRMRTKEGTYRWVAARARTVVDADGRLIRIVAGLQDIDELVRTQARLQATLDTEFDPHVVLTAVRDETGQIADFVYTEANRAACEYNGLPRAQLLGRRLLDLMPGHIDSEIFEVYRAVVATGEPLKIDGFAYENELKGGEVRRYDVQTAKLDDGLSYTWRDVTDQYAARAALAASEEIHRLLTENLSDVVVHLRAGTIAWVSPSLTGSLGWTAQDWLDHPIAEFIHPDDLGAVDEHRDALAAGGSDLFRLRIHAKDGRSHWIQVHAKPFYDRDGVQDGVVASFRIIDPEVAAEEDLEARARSDELTGLMNRREVLERVAVMTSHPRRTGEEAAVLFGDIDGFKAINDDYGHSAGDEVLHTVAIRVASCLRSGDIAARIGGDELLVLLDGVHELANAVDIADNIRRAVAHPIAIDGVTVTVTLSIGVTLAVPGESVDDMIARADEAMYEAKQAGGDRVVAKLPRPA
ncbi:PAS domain S-box protein [Pengzhenrongella frigida]|uniref:PAS domain S-box protein n=1 Tax=Pengzhenrongella frigida TaxID=1259133 RepID=A0A4Q5N2G5_9MICO|nr:PAS domain S-box protein [Cellulomonas sp. HLT2-17]RYV51423.1 PAS domain S-box protein [Cellulomonas sp. HLT2-17]